MGFLDYKGLERFLKNSREEFAQKSHTHDERYYTEYEIDNKLSKKSDVDHIHDDRYYTEAEVDGKLEKKSSTDHTHDLSELISNLSIGTSTTLNDAVQIITQDTDTANQKYYRRPLTVLWNYIKSKADSVYSAIGHNHKIQNLEDYTTRVWDATIVRQADTVLASPQDKDGIATFRKLDKNDVGLENVDNTADKNKNVATAGIATTGVRDYNNANNIIKIGWSGTELDANTLVCVAGYTSDKKIHPASKDGVRSWLGLGDSAYKNTKSRSSKGSTDWTNNATDDAIVPTMSFMAYWDGAYNSNGASNLSYCDRGRFGTIVTKGSGDYLPVSGGTMSGNITFFDIGNTNTSNKISWSGSTDGADIYYQTTVSDQGNLVLNLRDDSNCYLRIAKNGSFKSYFSPDDGNFHGNVNGTADSANVANFAKETYINQYKTVNLTDLDQNTWYPVTGISIPFNGLRRFKCNVQLNSGSKPSWSTHSGGFTAVVDILYESSGWGTTCMQGMVLVNDQIFINDSNKPPVGYQQMSNGSIPVWWLRGGGSYRLATDYDCTWTIRKSTYTNSGQSVSPTTTYPGVSVNRSTITANLNGNAKTATNATNSSNSDKWAGLSWRHNHNTTDTWIPVVSDNAFDYILKHEISADKLPLTGGTISGALNFANGTWNLVGDDAYMGDHNIGGSFCIMGANDTTRLGLVNKDNQGDYALVEYGGGNLNFNKKLGANITGHADGDLSLGGGTMSGRIIRSGGGSWISDRDNVAVFGNSYGQQAGYSYNPVVGQKTSSGAWTIGNLSGNESLIFNYSTDSNYNAGNNNTSQVYLPAQAGTIITSATIGNQTVNRAEYLGNDAAYMRMHWNGQGGQPTWLWGGNDASNMYVWNPSNFSVNYANSAGNGVTASGYNYVRFGDGTQMCWGQQDIADTGTTITFAVAFSSIPAVVNSGTEDIDDVFFVHNITTTNFVADKKGWYSGNNTWIAIGRWK